MTASTKDYKTFQIAEVNRGEADKRSAATSSIAPIFRILCPQGIFFGAFSPQQPCPKKRLDHQLTGRGMVANEFADQAIFSGRVLDKPVDQKLEQWRVGLGLHS